MTIEELLIEIGEPVEILYTKEEDEHPWRVSLDVAGTPEGEVPVHEHFADLTEGLLWLSRNGKFLKEQRARRRG